MIPEIAFRTPPEYDLFYGRVLQHGEGGLYRFGLYSYEFEEALWRASLLRGGLRRKVNHDFQRSYMGDEI